MGRRETHDLVCIDPSRGRTGVTLPAWERDMADGKRVIEVLSDICLPNLLVCLLNMFL